MSRRSSGGRWLIVAGAVALVLLGFARPVSAHASLLSSNPAADTVLEAAPTEIVLTFTESVDPTDEAIRLVAAGGTPVELGAVGQSRGSDSVSAAVPDGLGNGSYVVLWSVVSGDSHPISGAFMFSVGERSTGAAALVDDAFDDGAEPGTDLWLGVGRFASYAGITAFAGTLAAAVILTPSTLRHRRLGAVLFTAGSLAVVGTVVMICAQARTIGSSIADWGAVIGTRSGGWWVTRLAIVAAMTALVPWRRVLARRQAQVAAAVASLGVFAVVAAGGHAVSGRWLGIAFAATVIHLGAMAIWLGGLVLIALVVGRPSIVATAQRFSPLALGAVAVLAVTGAVNGWRQIGSLDGLTESGYARWLIVKLAIVGVVVAVAAMSRRIVRGGPELQSESAEPNSVGSAAASLPAGDAASLRRTLMFEVVGMLVILGATAGLAGATPAQPAAASTAVDFTVSVVREDQVAQIDLLPATTGGTVLRVNISSAAGSAVEEITVTAKLPAQRIGPIDIVTFPAGPNSVTTNEATFPIPGLWTITVTARYGEFDQLEFSADVEITNA